MRQFIRDARARGIKPAWQSFFHRRHLPLVGYIILTIGVALALTTAIRTQNESRQDLRGAAVAVVVSGCERDNQTRAILRGILASGIPAAKQYVKDGTLTFNQGERAIENSRDAIAALPDVDCQKVGEEFRRQSLDGNG